MDNLAIGQGQKKEQHHREVDHQERPHRDGLTQDQQREARDARQKEEQEEAAITRILRGVADGRIAPAFYDIESHGPYQQSQAAQGAENHGSASIGMRRDEAQQVIDRGYRRGREAQKESVEREVMEDAARLRVMLVRIGASCATARKIVQRQHVTNCLNQRRRLEESRKLAGNSVSGEQR